MGADHGSHSRVGFVIYQLVEPVPLGEVRARPEASKWLLDKPGSSTHRARQQHYLAPTGPGLDDLVRMRGF